MPLTSIDKRIRPINKSPFKKDFQNFRAELGSANSVGDLRQRIITIVNRLGFSDFMFLHANGKSLAHQDCLLTYPNEYLRQYREEGLYQHDAIIEYARENTRPLFSSHVYDYFYNAIFDTKTSRANRAIRQLNFAFGYFDSYVIPMVGYNDTGRLLFAVSQLEGKIADFRAHASSLAVPLKLLGQTINFITHDKFPSYFDFLNSEEENKCNQKPKVIIRRGPLRVLAALANNDMTITQVADKLRISPVTAHQHIASIRKTLDVKTNISAIKKAIKLGLITYD